MPVARYTFILSFHFRLSKPVSRPYSCGSALEENQEERLRNRYDKPPSPTEETKQSQTDRTRQSGIQDSGRATDYAAPFYMKAKRVYTERQQRAQGVGRRRDKAVSVDQVVKRTQ
jgi:hypothetical protein